MTGFQAADRLGSASRWKIILWMSALAFFFSCRGEDKAESAKNHMEKGLSAFRMGDFDKALEEYRAACRNQPESAEAHNYLGMALRYKYHETGDESFRQEEVEMFSKAVSLKKNWWVPRINLATTLWEMGKRKSAAKHYRKGLEINPDHPDGEAIKKRISEAEIQTEEKEEK